MPDLSKTDLAPVRSAAANALQLEGTAEDLYQAARNAVPKDQALIAERFALLQQARDTADKAEKAFELAILDSEGVRGMLAVLALADEKLKHEADVLKATAKNLKEVAAILGIVAGIVTTVASFGA